MSFDPRLGSKYIFAFLLLVVSNRLFPIWGVYDNDIIRTLGVIEPYGHKSSRQRDSSRSSWTRSGAECWAWRVRVHSMDPQPKPRCLTLHLSPAIDYTDPLDPLDTQAGRLIVISEPEIERF